LTIENYKFGIETDYMQPEKEDFIEKVLLTKLKAGEKNAFSAIFIKFYQDLVLFALNFTHEAESAEEIVQDTFVKIWEEHDIISIKVSLKSYLLKSVHNKCIDWLRHLKVRQNYNDEISSNPISYDFNTETFLINSELEDLVRITLDKLSPEVARAYRMHRFEGLKYNEIAKKLNVSVRTVEVRIGKALCSLRDELKDYLN
jgi:RNA polymerase sigma-70 factor (ECF subfamily)